MPYLCEIAEKLKAKHPAIPLIVYPKGAHYAISKLAEKSKYDVVGLDWTLDPATVRQQVKGNVALQGNLDPCVLYAPKEVIREEVGKMLRGFGTQGLVANLGHGLHPAHDPEHVAAFIDAVHEISAAMNDAAS